MDGAGSPGVGHVIRQIFRPHYGSRRYSAMAKVDRSHMFIDIHFFAPAVVGDRLRILSRFNRVFGSSMEVGVRVECEKLRGGSTHLNSYALLLSLCALPANIYPVSAVHTLRLSGLIAV